MIRSVLIFFSGWIALWQFAAIRTFDDIGIAKLSALGLPGARG